MFVTVKLIVKEFPLWDRSTPERIGVGLDVVTEAAVAFAIWIVLLELRLVQIAVTFERKELPEIV